MKPSASIRVVGTFALALSACGVPEEGRFIPIEQSQVPDALVVTTTTASTTTTVAIAPENTSTTVADVLYDSVELYFVSANRVVRSERRIVSPATPPKCSTLFSLVWTRKPRVLVCAARCRAA